MLIPTKENIQRLFETHQNQCAIYDCDRKIIDENGSIFGNIFFIDSNVEGQPRFNEELTNEQMTDFHNLILLCDLHGYEVMQDERQYSVQELHMEISADLNNLSISGFKMTSKMIDDVLIHFNNGSKSTKLSNGNNNGNSGSIGLSGIFPFDFDSSI